MKRKQLIEQKQLKELEEVSYIMIVNTVATILGAIASTVFAILSLIHN